MNKQLALLIGLSCLATPFAMQAEAAPKVSIKKDTKSELPEIWQKVPAAKRLQAVRAAELDATRILAERVMGVSLDGNTTIKDLAQADDTVKAALTTTLKGVKTVGKPVYHEDGRVEVIRAVKIRSLIETATENLKTGKVTVSQEYVTEEIDALGNSAIPGSDGHARILAKRAAELDAYRRLAERACGVQITSEATLRDFAMESDEIRACFNNAIKGAEITEIAYSDDNTAEVTVTLKLGPLVKVITKTISAKGKVLKTEETTKQLVLEETGAGAPPTAGDGKESAATAATSTEIDLIISSALESEPSL